MNYKAIIFDLDGVICSTDEYHYQAWKALADRLGIPFDRTINNRLRGVSRMESLEIILEKAERAYTAEEKEAYYGEHTADFEGVDYYAFTVNAGDFMAKDTEGNPVGDTTEASATAKAEAEKLAAAGSVDEFKSLIADYITANHDHEHDEATVNAEVESCFNYHKEAAAISSRWLSPNTLMRLPQSGHSR